MTKTIVSVKGKILISSEIVWYNINNRCWCVIEFVNAKGMSSFELIHLATIGYGKNSRFIVLVPARSWCRRKRHSRTESRLALREIQPRNGQNYVNASSDNNIDRDNNNHDNNDYNDRKPLELLHLPDWPVRLYHWRTCSGKLFLFWSQNWTAVDRWRSPRTGYGPLGPKRQLICLNFDSNYSVNLDGVTYLQ